MYEKTRQPCVAVVGRLHSAVASAQTPDTSDMKFYMVVDNTFPYPCVKFQVTSVKGMDSSHGGVNPFSFFPLYSILNENGFAPLGLQSKPLRLAT